jgi:Asp-tRNA(Asn)/Glu-tRNA(Gln) amidotransferase A subunit family amidase
MERPITVTEAAARLRAGEVTSVELTRRCIDAADRLDGDLGTYIVRFDDEAMAAAARADEELAAGTDRGPLHGIPVGVKDILAMAEGPTTAQSLVLDPAWGEGKDAPVVTRLKAGGAVITGKLTTMEFAVGFPDPTKPFPIPRNPWDVGTWPGGSSSGTGNGIAAGMFLAGIGTDTAGSIRIPAAFCGTSGLMPTYGRVPKSGCVPLGYSLDHIGPLARSARDCGAMLGVIAGFDASDPTCVERPVPDFVAGLDGRLDGVRVGVERTNHFPDGADPALVGCFDAAVDALTGLGADVVEVTLPHYGEVATAVVVTMAAEALAYHRNDIKDRGHDYFAGTRQILAMGALASSADYVQAQRVRRLAQGELAELFRSVDVIASPTAAIGSPSYELLDRAGIMSVFQLIFTAYWDGVGNPVLVVPMGFTEAGLPLSLQLAGRPFEEGLLVRAGDAFQSVTDWHLQVAPVVSERLAAV